MDYKLPLSMNDQRLVVGGGLDPPETATVSGWSPSDLMPNGGVLKGGTPKSSV